MQTIQRYLVAFFILFGFKETGLKAQNSNDCRYFAAINYICTNLSFNNDIKAFFKISAKKQRFTDFAIYDTVSFIGIGGLEERLKEKKFIPDTQINSRKYFENKYFNSYHSSFLKKMNWVNDSKIYLSFSKPTDNYLIAELTDLNPYLNRGRKSGHGMIVFFKFDSDGLVEDVIYVGFVYN